MVKNTCPYGVAAGDSTGFSTTLTLQCSDVGWFGSMHSGPTTVYSEDRPEANPGARC